MFTSQSVNHSVDKYVSEFTPLPHQTLNSNQFKKPLEYFINQMELSGAKVYVNKNDYYFSKAIGPISSRLCGKTRKCIRKSLAFLRIRKFSNCCFRAHHALATNAAIFISKEDMITLELTNRTRSAKLYISAAHIYYNMEEANSTLAGLQSIDGYYLTGPQLIGFTQENWLRSVHDLRIYIIKMDDPKPEEKLMFC